MTDNPLQKYVDAIDNPTPYVQPPLHPAEGQYILKALDFLVIYATNENRHELIEQPMHETLEGKMVDIIADAPIPEEE